MPILYGAVAYREDQAATFDQEIASWDLTRTYEHPIACPKGGDCDKTYMLIVEINASDEQSKEYVDRILRMMEKQDCKEHPSTIRIDPPQ